MTKLETRDEQMKRLKKDLGLEADLEDINQKLDTITAMLTLLTNQQKETKSQFTTVLKSSENLHEALAGLVGEPGQGVPNGILNSNAVVEQKKPEPKANLQDVILAALVDDLSGKDQGMTLNELRNYAEKNNVNRSRNAFDYPLTRLNESGYIVRKSLRGCNAYVYFASDLGVERLKEIEVSV